MQKVVGIVGSPRKSGNTSTLVKQVLKGAEEQGAETVLYHLNQLQIKGCQSCMYCRKHPGCAVKDDMQQIYTDLKEADAVVMGSPIYIHQVSGQLKIFWDRLYPLTDHQHKPRFGQKKLVMIYTQAAPFKIFFRKYINYNKKIFKAMGLEYHKTIRATKCFESDSVKQDQKVLDKALRVGQNLPL